MTQATKGIWTARNDFVRFLFVLLVLSCVDLPIFALNPTQPIEQLYHSAWNARNGLPGIVTSLAQSADGYLWVGTTEGLFRFDGIAFEHFKPAVGSFQAGSVSALLALPNGGLWIGYLRGGASFMIHGEVTNYSAYSGQAGFPVSAVRSFAQDWDGSIWAAVVGGLARFHDHHWERVRSNWNYLGGAPTAVFVDNQGTLWVADKDLIMFLPKGEKKFQNSGLRIDFRIDAFAQLADGRICFRDITHHLIRILHRQITPHAGGPPVQSSSSSRILVDRNAALWMTELPGGLIRIPFPKWQSGTIVRKRGANVEVFTDLQGLTDDETETALEDREGDVWIGTDGGLDRFRHRNLTWQKFTGRHYFSLVTANDGEIWAGTFPGKVFRIEDGRAVAGAPEDIWMTYREPDETIWFSAREGLWKFTKGRFFKVELPAELRQLRGHSKNRDPVIISAITRDNAGTLWVSISGLGEFKLRDGAWSFTSVLQGHPDWTARAAYTDSDGRVWLVYGDIVAVIDHGRVRTFSSRDDLAIGLPNTINGSGRQLWVGGESGIAFLQGDRFHTLVGSDGNNFGLITGIVPRQNDGLWLAAGPGIVHVPEREIQEVLRNPAHRVAYDVFDLISDLPEQLQRAGVYSSGIIQGPDNVLWFATRQGVGRIDPAHIERNLLPPPVSIRAVIADGKSYSSMAKLSLPPMTHTLQIDYEGLCLSIPERVRFRYKLDGADTNWQNPGTDRQAFYQGLAPGDYTFHVVASNNDGVWNQTGASVSFRILPAWFQTYWFRALCIFSILALIYIAYLLRMHRYSLALRARFNERLDERVRIARELHDTLLQGFHGVMFQFQAARNKLPGKPESAMRALDEAILATEQAIAEGRDAIRDLRPESGTNHDLAELLKAVAQDFGRSHGPSELIPSFKVIVEGQPKSLSPSLNDQVYRIAREVIRNAFHHANASRIEAEIRYTADQLRVRIRDDGKGIEIAVLNSSGRPGHWGLPGIRERAEQIGARLEFWSEAGAGTEIELTVPAAVAYVKVRSRHAFRLFQKRRSENVRS